jgi:hypothetical protein
VLALDIEESVADGESVDDRTSDSDTDTVFDRVGSSLSVCDFDFASADSDIVPESVGVAVCECAVSDSSGLQETEGVTPLLEENDVLSTGEADFPEGVRERVMVSVSVRVRVANSNVSDGLNVGRGVTVRLGCVDADAWLCVRCVLEIDGSSEGDPAVCEVVFDEDSSLLTVKELETVSVWVISSGDAVRMLESDAPCVIVIVISSDCVTESVCTHPTFTTGARAGKQNPSVSPIPIPVHTQSHAPVILELKALKHAMTFCKHAEQT